MRDASSARASNPLGSQKPEGPANWDEYFMRLAECVAEASKDDSKVGAVVVSAEKTVISTGYNGLARNVLDLEERIAPDDEKLRWVCRAEANAIFNAARLGVPLNGSTIYVTKFPCVGCANAIVQAGFVRVYTCDQNTWKKDPNGDDGSRSIRVLSEAGVRLHAPELPLAPAPKTKKASPGSTGPKRMGNETEVA
jgi:dCMP deaminase